MLNTEEQLTRLRQRLAAINERYTAAKPEPVAAPSAIEHWPGHQIVCNCFGEHCQSEYFYPWRQRHGRTDIGVLQHLPHDLFSALGAGQVAEAAPQRWAFLDTETTGLAGGSGTYAFLVGVGRITPDGFRVRQFFMREYSEERSLLAALSEHLSQFDVLITFNGKNYDQPLLETRYRMTRSEPPFARMDHLDLLYGARRIWKLRLDSCRLVELEQQILGYRRHGDVPGHLIPHLYFEYLRSREVWRLKPVFHHNALDIVTLACLASIVPAAFRDANAQSLSRLGIQHGEDWAGIAHWLLAAGQPERALDLLRRAITAGLPNALLFRTLWTVALLEKKQKQTEAYVKTLTELASYCNPHRVHALEELAKHFEHQENDYVRALALVAEALKLEPSEALQRRHARLERRLAKHLGAKCSEAATEDLQY